MTPAIDFSMIDMLRGFSASGDPDPIIELRTLFIEDGGRHLQELNHAITAGDERTARRTAHSLKGMSASIGALYLCELSDKLEKAAALDQIRMSELEQEFQRVSEALLAA